MTASREPAWKQRFTAPVVHFPSWSDVAPNRLVFTSSESGSMQAWLADMGTDERRQLTDQPNGVTWAHPTTDGSGAIWWKDDTGDERGHWMITRFDGGEARAAIPGSEDAWAEGIGFAPGVLAAAFSDDRGYRVTVTPDSEATRILAESDDPIGIGREWSNVWNGLSSDGRLLCMRVATQGNITQSGLRVIDTATGTTVGEQLDEGLHLRLAAWSPIPGDSRLAIVHELEEFERPAIWDLATGGRRNFSLDLPGGIDIAGWWPDGSALLAIHVFEGRAQLYRIDVGSGEATLVHDPAGWISGAAVRPDGEVWLRSESSAHPPVIRTVAGREVLSTTGDDPAPPGAAYSSHVFPNPAGQRIHMFVAHPGGSGTHPTVMMVHGGPDWAYPDAFDPHVQAFVDHGYVVAMVNYRGSTTYGTAFESMLRGNIGFPETEDVIAGLDRLIAEGIADPERVVIEGWSWGGYISLLAPGLHPDRFAAAIGGIPVADYIACHEDSSPVQQAWDRAYSGGTPKDKPEYYRERSPITYVDRIRIPILLIAGENDSACPIRQVRNFEEAIRSQGGTIETSIYEGGHYAASVEALAGFAETELDFLHRHVPGVPAPKT